MREVMSARSCSLTLFHCAIFSLRSFSCRSKNSARACSSCSCFSLFLRVEPCSGGFNETGKATAFRGRAFAVVAGAGGFLQGIEEFQLFNYLRSENLGGLFAFGGTSRRRA